MYNVSKNRTFVFKNWNTKCYIAKKLPSIIDEYGNEITVYDKPKQYTFNIQPISAESEAREFGELASNMRVAIVYDRNFMNEYSEFDLAYINASPYGETVNGENANYRIYAIRPQNVVLKVYFLKI